MDAGRDWPLENLPTIDDVLDHIDHGGNLLRVWKLVTDKTD